MSTLPESTPPSNLEPWPRSIDPSKGRTYDSVRLSSRRWVDGLVTRNGIPRWFRIRRCGAPVPLWRVDGSISWEHHWCKDRACYACARSRSRKLGQQLRDAMQAREGAPLHFVTLTRPRTPGESCASAWRAFQRAWEAVRHAPEWKACVVGGLRAMEVVWSTGHERAKKRIPGWHVHAHIIVELANDVGARVPCPACDGAGRARGCRSCSSATVLGDGKMPAGIAAVLERWAAIVGGSVRAQNAVPLDTNNVGQLAKYLTKMFELAPDQARTVYEAAANRHIVQGFGSWTRWKRWADVERTPHGWFPAGVPVSQLERMAPTERVRFYARGSTVEATRGDSPVLEGDRWTPRYPVAEVSVAQLLAALRADDRPVWERIDDTAPDHAQRCEETRRIIDFVDRQANPHHFRCGRDPPLWEH